MSENNIVTEKEYHELYRYSINEPELYWSEQAKRFVTWFSPWDKVIEGNFTDANTRWFLNAKLNVSYNCLDRHLPNCSNQIALIWEGDDPSQSCQFTYQELFEKVCYFANVLKNSSVKKGDRVCIYLPMIPEVVVAMLACARIGAIHTVVFGGFSSDALKTRILSAECNLIVTADAGIRGNKIIHLKENVDKALENFTKPIAVVVIKKVGNPIQLSENRDYWYHNIEKNVDSNCEPVWMDANDPLFILYTSGSTGKPKGIMHSTGGYLTYVATTFKYIFNYKKGEIFWCTADVGWITGHSYLVYGPLCNGATTLIYEGVPYYPTYSRYWEIIDKHKVNIFYTSPTAIRALRHEGDEWLANSSRKSLRLLGSVGEPINPDVWEWYYKIVGKCQCDIVDTWWQTETGGILISPLPDITLKKPGAAAWPFFGISPMITKEGSLTITQPWPGLMLTIFQDQKRFQEYFTEIPGYYFTGDLARIDCDGYYWVLGRYDDVIKVSGHRIGTEEIESALLTHSSVSEAAVVSVPHAIKGNAIYVFVTIKKNIKIDDALMQALKNTVRKEIGPIATPEVIQFVDALPKTRSGKIMRRILRKIAIGEFNELGDLSTLADSSVIQDLIKAKME